MLILLWGALIVRPMFADSSQKPFWRTKTKVLKKITDERAIVVSVNAKKNGGVYLLSMHGGGMTNRAAGEAYAQAKKYENLKKVSDHILEAKFNQQLNQLYLHTVAFRYHARMTMKMEVDETNAKERLIRFRVIDGNFKGMTGAMAFEDFKPGATLMGFEAEYRYQKLPMPQFFVEFGLEVVLQKVAARMRTFLEKESPM